MYYRLIKPASCLLLLLIVFGCDKDTSTQKNQDAPKENTSEPTVKTERQQADKMSLMSLTSLHQEAWKNKIALDELIRRAETDPKAMFFLGHHYASNKLIQDKQISTQLYNKAFPMLETLALQGNPEAQKFLGTAYRYGLGTQKNKELAFKLYSKSAEQNNVDATFELAQMNDQLYEFDDNPKKAFELYQKAADLGNAHAQYVLGDIYQYGRQRYGKDIAEDIAKATKFYLMAAEQNMSAAQFRLSEIYYRSENNKESLELLKKSADNGYPEAQYRYGQLLMIDEKNEKFSEIIADIKKRGLTIEFDYKRGLELIQSAAALGNQGAIIELDRLKKFD